MPSTKYRKWGGGGGVGGSVVRASYLQLTWPKGWLARNFAALVSGPEV